jgi:hypothetical protein
MSKDIARILEGWDYDPEDVGVRVIQGDDGREKIQFRIDMGLLQMEVAGRPDGQRPNGCPSWLDYLEQKQREHDESGPNTIPFEIGEEESSQLWREALQYYHRYMSFWHLKRYDLCALDTARNLRLFDFVRSHASEDRIKVYFDRWRPYVLMIHTRAVATPMVEKKQYAEALKKIEWGIDAIRDFLEDYSQTDRSDECHELANLEQWREELVLKKERADDRQPRSAEQILRQKLKEAVEAERFEEAARLRDEIRKLSEPQ